MWNTSEPAANLFVAMTGQGLMPLGVREEPRRSERILARFAGEEKRVAAPFGAAKV